MSHLPKAADEETIKANQNLQKHQKKQETKLVVCIIFIDHHAVKQKTQNIILKRQKKVDKLKH